MNYLNSILDEEALDNIIETFDNDLLNKLDSNNIKQIIEYLKSNNIDFIEDILSYYTDLFIIEYPEFIRKFETLKQQFDQNFCENLGYELDLLERMWDI